MAIARLQAIFIFIAGTACATQTDAIEAFELPHLPKPEMPFSETCAPSEPQITFVRTLACQTRTQTCKAILPTAIHDSVEDFCAPERSVVTAGVSTVQQCLAQLPVPFLNILKGIAGSAGERQKVFRERVKRCKDEPDYRLTLQSLARLPSASSTDLPCENLVQDWEEVIRRQRQQSIASRYQDYTARDLVSRDGAKPSSGLTQLSEWLDREEDQISCLTSEAIAELWCYRLFYLVDPMLVAGMGMKAFKLVKHMRQGPSPNSPPIPNQVRAASLPSGKIPLAVPENPQIELWRLREQGLGEAAVHLEDGLRSTLKYGRIVRSSPVVSQAGERVGKSGAYWVEFENGLKGVWKPAEKFGANKANEIGAHLVDRHLGTNLVPLIESGQILNGVEGTVQIRVTGLHAKDMRAYRPQSLSVYDHLIGNHDRHSGNYLMTEQGRPVAIDHGLAFNRRVDDLPSTIIDMASNTHKSPIPIPIPASMANLAPGQIARYRSLRELQALGIDRNIIERLRKTTKEDWTRLLGETMSQRKIDQLFQRQQRLIMAIDHAEKRLGPGIYRGGPFTPTEFFQKTDLTGQ